jgi:hypothetical protein
VSPRRKDAGDGRSDLQEKSARMPAILGEGASPPKVRTCRETEKVYPGLLVREFGKPQTEGPQKGTKTNVTNGPVRTGLSGSILLALRVGTQLLSQLLR